MRVKVKSVQHIQMGNVIPCFVKDSETAYEQVHRRKLLAISNGSLVIAVREKTVCGRGTLLEALADE